MSFNAPWRTEVRFGKMNAAIEEADHPDQLRLLKACQPILGHLPKESRLDRRIRYVVEVGEATCSTEPQA